MQEAFDHITDGFPVIGSSNPDIARAAEKFVATKIDMDFVHSTEIGRRMIEQATGEQFGYRTIDPYAYVSIILPFFHFHRSGRGSIKGKKALVPPKICIGDSWNWSPEHRSAEEITNITRKVHEAFQNSADDRAGYECASYGYISKLGIVVAHEGKNRVALFRELGLDIPAVVSDEDYPDATRIRMFTLREGNFAVLDNRFVERVISLEIASDVLEPYGVALEKTWPDSYPDIRRVIDEMETSICWRDDHYKSIDLIPLWKRQKAEETRVPASMCDIESPLRPSMRFFLAVFSASFLFCALLPLATGWPVLQGIFGTLALGVAGLGVLVTRPLFKIEVQKLTEDRRMDWRHQIISGMRDTDVPTALSGQATTR